MQIFAFAIYRIIIGSDTNPQKLPVFDFMIHSQEQFAFQIRQRGFRLTPQRVAIVSALLSVGDSSSPLELFEKASAALPGLTEPTLYRTLDFLVAKGFVNVTARGRRLFYALAQSSQYILTCTGCGFETEMTPEQVQYLDEQMQQISGFKLVENQIKFMGLCPSCQ